MTFDSLDVINHNALDNIRALAGEGSENLLNQIIEIFLNDMPEKISQLEQAHQQQDLGNLRAIAHSMKSASANLGAMRVSALFKELENAGRSNEPEDVPVLLERLNREYKTLEPFLKQLITTD